MSVLTQTIDNHEDVPIPMCHVPHISPFLNRLLKYDPNERPDAATCLFDHYFSPMNSQRDSNTDRRRCMVCFDEFWLDEGVFCTLPDHYTCNECFGGYVKSSTEDDVSLWKERDGDILCPFPTCTVPCPPSSFLSAIDEATFKAYMKK
jgi:hypothetical protein